MRFLVDESTGRKVSQELARRGFDTASVVEDMRGASDEEVVARAVRENRIIVTNDKDFGWLAAAHRPPGLILLRLRDERAENKVRVILNVIQRHGHALRENIVIATEKRVRIRPL